jgi:hypothetical protein
LTPLTYTLILILSSNSTVGGYDTVSAPFRSMEQCTLAQADLAVKFKARVVFAKCY